MIMFTAITNQKLARKQQRKFENKAKHSIQLTFHKADHANQENYSREGPTACIFNKNNFRQSDRSFLKAIEI